MTNARERGYRPGVTVIDAGYGNNTPFLKQLESRNLTYVAAIAKNRQVTAQTPGDESARKQGLEAIRFSYGYAVFRIRKARGFIIVPVLLCSTFFEGNFDTGFFTTLGLVR